MTTEERAQEMWDFYKRNGLRSHGEELVKEFFVMFIDRIIREEREACAKVARHIAEEGISYFERQATASEIAKKIRARENKNENGS